MAQEINKRKYVHEILLNRSFKLDQEKVWLGELFNLYYAECLKYEMIFATALDFKQFDKYRLRPAFVASF